MCADDLGQDHFSDRLGTVWGPLREKGKTGAQVRLLFGDPASREVARRSEDEGIGRNTIGVKIRNVLTYFKSLDGAHGVQIRCHGTTLYNSLYRFDDEMIVNTHVYGFAAPHVPTLHLRRLTGGDLFETYSESFESVWTNAKPPSGRRSKPHDPHRLLPRPQRPPSQQHHRRRHRLHPRRPRPNPPDPPHRQRPLQHPGGAQDIGETITQTVIREVKEETGIDVEVTGLVGIYTDPHHIIAYDNGEVCQEFLFVSVRDQLGIILRQVVNQMR